MPGPRLLCAFVSVAAVLGGQTVGAAGPGPRPEQQSARAQAASPAGPQTGGQSAGAEAAAAGLAVFAGLPGIDGPPAPIAPEVVRRDDKGNATIRATRIERPLDIDGRLNDEAYRQVPAIGGFIQQLPREGQPATEPTEVWILFDDDTLYVAGHCIETTPERAVANELRRDHNNIFQTDNITVVFDTFYDRRNGFFFQTNQLSAVRDQAISENEQLVAWNTVWNVRSARVEDGWTFEMAIPFKSLRYRQPGPQVWGINVRRVVKWKNETSLLTALPASYGSAGVSQMGSAATLVGLEAPGLSKNLELKPYVAASLTTDETAQNPFRDKFGRDLGVDVKYGLTSSLVADLTVNTDFAQVEEDVQQVNLTRFNLQFPEKRDFFLEGQGIFTFGRAQANAGADVPIVFFSRRVGLAAGQAVPVQAGGRVTGKAGAWNIGFLNIQTGEKTVDDRVIAVPTNFSVVRVKRDIFRRSSIGIIATQKFVTSGGDASNLAAGADATFRFSDATTVTGYYAQTSTPGAGGDGASYRGRFDYNADRYGFAAEHLLVDGEFNPEVGFTRRDDFRRSFGQVRFSPRSASGSRLIRRFSYQGSIAYVTNADASVLENRALTGNFDMEFHSGDSIAVDYAHEYEFLADDFTISRGVIVPAGSYDSDSVRMAYTLGQQRVLSGTAAATRSTLYNGTRYETTYSGRIGFIPQFAVEPSVTLNWVDLPYGAFTAKLFTNRFIVTPTPRLSVTGLVQVNASADTVSSSLRLRWEYRPGSELFLVYSDGRDTAPGTPIGLMNRSIAVKATRLLRF